MTDADIINRIYDTGYFTNHGPLAIELEETLERLYGIENAIIVSNEMLAIVMALSGLDSNGAVLMEGNCPEHLYNAVTWSGQTPFSIELDQQTQENGLLAKAIETNKASVLLLYGIRESRALQEICDEALLLGLKVVLYKEDNFTDSTKDRFIYKNDGLIVIRTIGEVTPSLLTNNCSVILTSNDEQAEKYRNIRSSYGARKLVSVTATANGRVSEYQAGKALYFLESKIGSK